MGEKNHNNFYILLIIIILTGCKQAADRPIDISKSTLEVQYVGLEKIIFEGPKMDSSRVLLLDKQYKGLFDVYVERILNIGSVQNAAVPSILDHFSQDMAVRSVYEEAKKCSTIFESKKDAITEGMKRYHEVFPNRPVLKVATFVNGFNYYAARVMPRKVFVSSDYIALGLDMYLGKEYVFYEKYGFPAYFIAGMESEYMVADLFRGLLYTELVEVDAMPEELVYRMIYEGRLLYMLTQLIPSESFYACANFTPGQLQWCEAHEASIWNTLVNNELLYETSALKVDHFFTEGPFTKDFPKESPARAVVWLGYKIVCSYMQNNEVSLPQLMQVTDLKSIFVESGYKPH